MVAGWVLDLKRRVEAVGLGVIGQEGSLDHAFGVLCVA